MLLHQILGLAACGGILVLALLVLGHRGRSPLALPLGLLCGDMFIWNFATWAYRYSGVEVWRYLDITFSPLTPPLTLHVVLVFVGRLGPLRPLLLLAYLLFGALSLSGAAAFISAGAREWIQMSAWSLTYIGLWTPLLGLATVLLLQHRRRQVREDERMRTRLLLGSMLVGAALGAIEMIDEMVALPPFDYDHLGAFVATALNAMVVLRFRLLGSDWSARAVVFAAALGLLGLVGYLVAFRLLATQLALLLLTVATITLGLAAALRGTVRSAAERWQRERQLLFLGRFSAQMAHDLKNPLAALKGALDYLLEARARGAAAEDEQSFLQLMRQQTVRIEDVLRHYQRFGEQPRCESVDLRPLLEAVIAQATAKAPQIAVSREIDPALPRCWADPELISRACENIVANAIDAMPEGGRLSVRARATAIDATTPGVSIVVEDDGPGMDPRQLALACEEFYSSKGSSGLGLTFVQRVARDHGGELQLQSVLGRGTTAEIRLPGTETQGRGRQ